MTVEWTRKSWTRRESFLKVAQNEESVCERKVPVLLWKSGRTLVSVSLQEGHFLRTSPKGYSVSIQVSWKSRSLPKGNIVNFQYCPTKLSYAHLQNSIPRKSLNFNTMEAILKADFASLLSTVFKFLIYLACSDKWKTLISVMIRMHQTDTKTKEY